MDARQFLFASLYFLVFQLSGSAAAMSCQHFLRSVLSGASYFVIRSTEAPALPSSHALHVEDEIFGAVQIDGENVEVRLRVDSIRDPQNAVQRQTLNIQRVVAFPGQSVSHNQNLIDAVRYHSPAPAGTCSVSLRPIVIAAPEGRLYPYVSFTLRLIYKDAQPNGREMALWTLKGVEVLNANTMSYAQSVERERF